MIMDGFSSHAKLKLSDCVVTFKIYLHPKSLLSYFVNLHIPPSSFVFVPMTFNFFSYDRHEHAFFYE
jgi:hypothetical protein